MNCFPVTIGRVIFMNISNMVCLSLVNNLLEVLVFLGRVSVVMMLVVVVF